MELAEFQQQWAEAQRLHPLPARQTDFDLAPRIFEHGIEADETVTAATLWACDDQGLYVLRLRAAACLQLRRGLAALPDEMLGGPAGHANHALARLATEPPRWLDVPSLRVAPVARRRTLLRMATFEAGIGFAGPRLEEDVDIRLDRGLAASLRDLVAGERWFARLLARLDRAVS